MRVAIYLLLNPDDRSVSSQRPDLLAYLNARGWGLVAEFHDIGYSTAGAHRDGLDRLMAGARQKRFEAVLIWRLSRWACDLRRAVSSLDELDSLGVRLIALQDGIDTEGQSGAGPRKIIKALVRLERDARSERIKEGIARARRAGKIVGRPARGVEAASVISLRESGMSLRKIARQTGLSKTGVARLLRGTEGGQPVSVGPQGS